MTVPTTVINFKDNNCPNRTVRFGQVEERNHEFRHPVSKLLNALNNFIEMMKNNNETAEWLCDFSHTPSKAGEL